MSSKDPASTLLKFNNSIFEEKFNNGWLKSYYYGVLILALAVIAHAVNTIKNGLYFMNKPLISGLVYKSDGTWTGTYDYYDTRIVGLTLFALAITAILLALGLFFQFLAIKEKDLEKQSAVINIANYFIGAQARAAGFNIFFSLFSAPISTFAALFSGLIFLAIGIGFKFLACNVKNIMLGKAEESFKFDKEAITKFKLRK